MTKLMYLTILLLLFVFIPGCQDQTGVVNSPIDKQTGNNVLAKLTILNEVEEVVPFTAMNFVPCANGGSGEDVGINDQIRR